MRAETLYLREVDLAELCREGAEKLRELVPETVQVNAREIPAVFLWVCDREQVEIALYNLLTNAVNAHASKIGIALYRREYAVDITVSDNGVGLSPGAAFRLHNAWQLPLTDTEMLTRVASHEAPGMGVPLIFRAAALHGGVVRYEPNGTQGTKVRFILPDGLREDPNNLHCPFRFDNAQSISNLELSGLR